MFKFKKLYFIRYDLLLCEDSFDVKAKGWRLVTSNNILGYIKELQEMLEVEGKSFYLIDIKEV